MGVRWGIVSTARINDAVLAGAALTDEADVVAVAGRDEERTRAYAREKGIPRAHTGYDALLADPEIEAVYISLPNGMHVDWSIRALEAGKHVLCEKPLSARAAEVERAFDAADAADRLLMEAFMWRHNPQTTTLARLIGEGAIGELRLVRANFSFLLADTGDVRLDPALEGGALMDVGTYCVSAARLVAGEPHTVTAQQVTAPNPTGDGPGVDARLAAVMRHGGGVLAAIDCAIDLPRGAGLEVVGSTGSLVVPDPWHARSSRVEIHREGADVEVVATEPANSYRLELDNLSAAIRGEAEPLLGRADAVGQARALEALYASAAAGGAPTTV
jgi:predicted dehydrogenase